MVKLVDTQDLKSCGFNGRAGSIPAPGTKSTFYMIQFKLFKNSNTKKKTALIVLLIIALLFVLGKNYISINLERGGLLSVVKSPSIRIHLVNIAKVAIPLKNHILMEVLERL